ncbi:MAG: hypothetical protein PVH23_00325 [candidate division WOR-3 bacterium]
MKKILIAGIALTFVFSAILWAEGGFRGYVTRYDTQATVENAKVKWVKTGHTDSTSTNKNGYYEKYNQPDGWYNMTASKLITDVWWTDEAYEEIDGGMTDVDFELRPGHIEKEEE